jgi:Holliday junction resolvase RusA-like endonuclease
MQIEFFVTGEPVPKQSFRAGGRNGGHTDPRVKAWQTSVGWEAQSAKITEMVVCTKAPVVVSLDFYLGNRRIVDLDNLSKGVLDGLKGVLFVDDSQVVELHLRKFIDKQHPGVNVEIKPAKAGKEGD